MRIIILLLILTAAAPAASQPELEGTEPLWSPDRMLVLFDASVDWFFGGILMSPILEYVQTLLSCDAYLVLVQPTADDLGGYRVSLDVAGDHVVTATEVPGAPLSVQYVGDDVTVAFDPSLPMTGEPVVLYRWSLFNSTFHPVSFYVKPPAGATTPLYVDGAGTEIPASTFNGAYHDFQVPVAVLNGMVTPNEEASFGDVKKLFR